MITPDHLLIACLVLITCQTNLMVAGEDFRKFKIYKAQAEKPDLEPEDVWIDAFDDKICGAAKIRPWQAMQSAFGCAEGLEEAITTSSRRDKNKTGFSCQVSDTTSKLATLGEFPFFVHFRIKGTKRVLSRMAQSYCPRVSSKSRPIACDGTEPLEHFGRCVNGKFLCSAQNEWEETVPYTRECSGILVDKNLVITQNACLQEAPVRTIELIFGTNYFGASRLTNNVPEIRRASKWCHQSRFFKDSSSPAVIQLDTPINYIEGKIWPVCLRTSPGEHLNDSVCVSPLDCPDEPLKSVAVKLDEAIPAMRSKYNSYRKLDDRLMWDECYSGGPIICYDNCSKKEKKREKVQAFAVGINWDFGDADARLARAINFEKARGDFYNLLLMVQKGVKRHPHLKCSKVQ